MKKSKLQKFVIQPLPWSAKDAKEPKRKKPIPWPLPLIGGNNTFLCWNMLARRESGKTTLMANLVRTYYPYMSQIIILSPTVFHDENWEPILKWEKVCASDEVTNKQIESIFRATSDYEKSDPNREEVLVIIDDSSDDFKRTALRQQLTRLFTRGRHNGIHFLLASHGITFLEGPMITGTSQLCIWDMNKSALKLLCAKISTRRMDENKMMDYISQATEQDYSFAFIFNKDPYGNQFYLNFDKPYDVPT